MWLLKPIHLGLFFQLIQHSIQRVSNVELLSLKKTYLKNGYLWKDIAV